MWPSRALSRHFVVSFLAVSLIVSQALAENISCAWDRAVFNRDGASLVFRVEIADDAAERAKGLMYRKKLDPMSGMLFVYEQPREVSFWMRNTLIPLDMIFIDERGVVRHIHREARPLDETPIPGAVPGDDDPDRLLVLEIAGGEARRLGLHIGDVLSHPALDRSKAVAPCN